MEVWTDGSKNSSGSGWAVICPSQKLILCGRLQKVVGDPTNQQAELSAAIQAVFKFGTEIIIYTDSTYVIGCFSDWYRNWLTNGWKNAKKKPVENQGLIKLGLSLKANLATYKHVKAHSGEIYNEMADYYADAKVTQLSPFHFDWTLTIV